MPLFYQQNINQYTRLAVWKIEEPEVFFLESVPLQSNITHPQKRLQHLAGRYLLAHLFPGFPYSEIAIADTRKPFLPNELYHFSISHCGDFAAAIVSTKNRVGIDVEMISPRVDKIKHKFLHGDELRFINAQLPSAQLELLTLFWSAKEALFKWYSFGEIDFSEMLRLFPFEPGKEGSMNAAIIKNQLQQSLLLQYKVFENLCLVYTNSEV